MEVHLTCSFHYQNNNKSRVKFTFPPSFFDCRQRQEQNQTNINEFFYLNQQQQQDDEEGDDEKEKEKQNPVTVRNYATLTPRKFLIENLFLGLYDVPIDVTENDDTVKLNSGPGLQKNTAVKLQQEYCHDTVRHNRNVYSYSILEQRNNLSHF